ncbi:alanine--tRNA ligase [Actinoplanes sp. NBRC 103695]|uniref:alanine--tRNA ligase n=1 Tax=Actinoplanes sp. NBRC 103695 TaxID=3032202 RepID=UPI0024A4EC75|nr:alanine--tRNA ligase [Actinoplanes sp. NBRC 103695]GLZ01585.1 alanine--tRNA ligase [Actinoplanes sp. NBRC 103695]
MRTAEIKRRYLDHFERQGHTVVPSAPLPAVDDPNLLFINAGMVQFVPFFLGQQAPPYARAVSVQKCIRTPDIDEVGKTSRHGTFFQMNGNFSFGDYFKAGAIPLAWELSTKPVEQGGFGLDPENIWATVYLDDDEAIEIWKQQPGMSPDRIVRRGKKDNFWSMGIPGPAGPCSELYYDRGPAYGPDGGPEVDEDRFLEYWNLVFMQHEITDVKSKEDFTIVGDLPKQNIDTGMGLERIASILQGVDNLYEIDEVRPILDRAAALTGTTYGKDHTDDVRLRVIADHVRTALMLIGDGITPSNEGRGYVLRRIMRRAVRAIRLLGFEDKALPELLPVARDCMAPSYPEVAAGFDRIADQAYGEEETFLSTLKAGTTILDTALAGALGGRLSGAKAFQLHDTYGFPIDLTLEIAAEQGVQVDADGFRSLMAEQRARAKADAKARKTGHADLSAYRAVLDQHGPTDWLAYETLETESRVLAVWPSAAPDVVTVALDRSPFYAESGGQDSDAGLLTGPQLRAEIIDVQRPVKGLIAHTVRILDGTLAAGDTVHATVDPEWRTGARQAHSGTHVVHAALRQVLGPTALQSGSYNRPGYLRLDFAWRGGLSDTARTEVEEVANLAIRRDLPVGVHHLPLAQAREEGALALFGETYDDTVRVVEIGGAWSRELCGGTHVEHSAQIGSIALTSESSVGAGQRRIEAVTGIEAFRYLARERDLVGRLAAQLKARPEELPDRITALMDRMKLVEQEAHGLRDRILDLDADGYAAHAVDLAGVAYVGVTTTGDGRRLAEKVSERLGRRPGVIGIVTGPSIVVAVTAAGIERGLSAAALTKLLLAGRGGGSAALAQGKAAGDPAALLVRLRDLLAAAA